MFLQDIFGYISRTKILNIIPLDIIFHIIVGVMLTQIFLRLKVNFFRIFIIVLLLSLLKEYNDSFILGSANTMNEHIKDIFFTIIPVIVLYLFNKAKSTKEQCLLYQSTIQRTQNPYCKKVKKELMMYR